MTSTITIFPCTKGTSVSRHSHHPHQAEKSGSNRRHAGRVHTRTVPATALKTQTGTPAAAPPAAPTAPRATASTAAAHAQAMAACPSGTGGNQPTQASQRNSLHSPPESSPRLLRRLSRHQIALRTPIAAGVTNPVNSVAAATTELLGWPVMAKTSSARTMTAGAGSQPPRPHLRPPKEQVFAGVRSVLRVITYHHPRIDSVEDQPGDGRAGAG